MGGARSFSSGTDKVLTANVAGLKPTGAQTQAIWVKINGSVGSRSDFFNSWATSSSADGSWLMTLINTGGGLTFQYFLTHDSTSAVGLNSTYTPVADTWNYVVTTFDGTNTRIYVNGVLKNTGTPGFATTYSNAIGVYFGQSNDQSLIQNVTLADGAIWNVTLTLAEISALALGMRPYQIRKTNLLGWWPLDGLASPEPDLSGNAYNGTLTGTASAFGPPITMFTPRWPRNIEAVATPPSPQPSMIFPMTVNVEVTVG